jgi:hypothetical protein
MRWLFPLLLTGCGREVAIGINNDPPTADIVSHLDNDTVYEGYATVFHGVVGDADNALDSLTVRWRHGPDALCEGEADDLGQTSCAITLTKTSTVTLEVLDPANALGSDSVTVGVTETQPPTAEITSPSPDLPAYVGFPVTLTGRVGDAEDDAEDLKVVWSSSLDSLEGEVGAEAGQVSLVAELSAGHHVITLAVEDKTGKSAQDQLGLWVKPANSEPSCQWVAPVNQSVAGVGELTTFEVVASDPDVAPGYLSVRVSSDRDGALFTVTPNAQGLAATKFAGLTSGQHELTATVTDELGAACSTTVAHIVTDPPQVAMDQPLDGATLFGATFTVKGSALDDADTPDLLSVELHSSVDGLLDTPTAESNGRVSSSVPLSRGEHTLTLSATDTFGQTGSAVVTVMVNGAPTEPVVSLSPDEPTTTDKLQAKLEVEGEDPEGTDVNHTWSWTQDGVATNQFKKSVAAAHTSVGEQWTVTVAATDQDGGTSFASASVTIGNAVPSIENVSITPLAPSTSHWLTCSWTFLDDDGDADQSTVRWFIDSVEVGTGDTLNADETTFDDEVSCEVTPFDGAATGIAETSSIGIEPTVPTVDEVVVTALSGNLPPLANDVLACAYSGWTDPDEATEQPTFAWYVGTDLVGELVTVADVFDKGDVVRCEVVPDNGLLIGPVAFDEVSIANSAPVVSDVEIEGSMVGDVLTCVWDWHDTDGDDDASSVLWLDSSGSVLGSGQTYDAANHATGDEVTCAVTPWDGETSGHQGSATIALENGVPSVSNVEVSPSSPTPDQSLACSWDAYDPDGQDDAFYEVVWRVGSTELGTGHTLAPGGYDAFDYVVCAVTAMDADATGNTASGGVSIAPRAPSIDSIFIDAQSGNMPPLASDVLVCSYTGWNSDDGGTESPKYAWYRGTELLGEQSALAGVFSKHDAIRCEITPNNGVVDGPTLTTEVTIANSVPAVSQVAITPDTPETDDDILCTWNFSDADGPSEDASTVIWKDGSNQVIDTGTTLDVAVAGGDTITCEVTPWDGESSGTMQSDSAEVEFSQPSITSVEIVETDPTVATDLHCVTTGYVDPQEDPDASVFTWKNITTGEVLQSSTVGELVAADHADALAKGDIVRCRVVPSDGDHDGQAQSAQVTLVNATPVVSNLTLVPHVPQAGADATCAWSFADADSDTDLSKVVWFLDDDEQVETSATFAVLPEHEGLSLTCEVTADDGDQVGNTDTVLAYLPAVTPSIQAVAIEDLSAVENGPTVESALQCTIVGYLDPDTGDDVGAQSTYEWHDIQGHPVAGTQVLSTFTKGDSFTCTATPYDGQVHGTPVQSAPVTIFNSPPDGFAVVVPYTQTSMADTLTCSIDEQIPDADIGDTVTYDFAWENDDGAYLDAVTAPDGLSSTVTDEFENGDDWFCTVTADDGTDAVSKTEEANITSSMFTQVFTHNLMSCGLRIDGTPICWGKDWPNMDNLPTTSGWTDFAGNVLAGCLLDDDGQPFCWSLDEVEDETPLTTEFVQLSLNGNYACGLTESGGYDCWGNVDPVVEFAHPPDDTVLYTPREVNAMGFEYQTFTHGEYGVCAIKDDRTVVCWGDEPSAADAPADLTFLHIVANRDRNTEICGLTTDHEVYCWGFGHTQPDKMLNGSDYEMVASGTNGGCALDGQGMPECWGAQTYPSLFPLGTLQAGGPGTHMCGVLWEQGMTPGEGEGHCWATHNDDGVLNVP